MARTSASELTADQGRWWDVVVVGAGPAGSTTARLLAREGHTVLLVDKQPFPRDKVCGDALIPDALRCLRRAGVYDQVRRRGFAANILAAFSPSRVRVDISGEFITLRRSVLDDLLVREAAACGAIFQVAEVTSLVPNARAGLTVGFAHSGQGIHARFCVLATGADVALPNKLGLVRRRRASAVAVRCYVRSPLAIDELVISFDRSVLPGYGWIFPLGGNTYNVGCGIFRRGKHGKGRNLRQAFDAFVRHFPLARDLLRAGEMETALRGALLRSGLVGAASHDGGRILSIGETIGATFNFTGEGIGKAMETGELAAQQIDRALVEDTPEHLREFPRILESELAPRYVGYRVAENWLSKPWFNDFVAKRVRRNRSLRSVVERILNETVDPRMMLSWQLLLPNWVPWNSNTS